MIDGADSGVKAGRSPVPIPRSPGACSPSTRTPSERQTRSTIKWYDVGKIRGPTRRQHISSLNGAHSTCLISCDPFRWAPRRRFRRRNSMAAWQSLGPGTRRDRLCPRLLNHRSVSQVLADTGIDLYVTSGAENIFARLPHVRPAAPHSHVDRLSTSFQSASSGRPRSGIDHAALSMPLASRAVLQMDQAAPAHQILLRHLRGTDRGLRLLQRWRILNHLRRRTSGWFGYDD